MDLKSILSKALEINDVGLIPRVGTLDALLENILQPVIEQTENTEIDKATYRYFYRQFRTPIEFNDKYTEERCSYEIMRAAREIQVEMNNYYSKIIYDSGYATGIFTFDANTGKQVNDWDKKLEGIFIIGAKGDYLKPTHDKYKLYVDLYMDNVIGNHNENKLSFKANDFKLTPFTRDEMDYPLKKRTTFVWSNVNYILSAIYVDDSETWVITLESRYDFKQAK